MAVSVERLRTSVRSLAALSGWSTETVLLHMVAFVVKQGATEPFLLFLERRAMEAHDAMARVRMH